MDAGGWHDRRNKLVYLTPEGEALKVQIRPILNLVYANAEEILSTFIFSLIRAIGLILLGFGVVQVGLSLKSHDPSQRANGFLTLAGGVIITFAKEILDLIVG